MLAIISAHSFQHFKVSCDRKPYTSASEYKIKGIQNSSSLAKLVLKLGPISGYRSQHLFMLLIIKLL